MGSRNSDNKSKGNDNSNSNRLPIDIIYDILKRVPAESLVRFKLVCKLWKTIISNRKFISSHLHLWKSKPSFIFSADFCLRPDRLLLLDLQDEDSTDFPVRFPQAYDEIVASTDGLLLLKSFLIHLETKLCVHNPVTGSKKKLPLNPNHSCSYWIVYDASIQKYKVVVFIDHDGDLNVQNKMGIITIDNDGDKGWRKLISPSAFCLGGAFQVITVNGILHWLAFTSDIMNCPFNPDLQVAFVQSMDIAKEEFRQGISLPCQQKIDYADYPYVQLINGNLLEMKGSIYFSNPATDTELELWMLEDLDNHIWAMKHKICLLSIVDKPNGLASFLVTDSLYTIQMIGNHGLIIFLEDSNSPYSDQMRWYLYDLRSHELKAIVSRSAEAKRCYFYSCLHITLVKSLVSWNIPEDGLLNENWNGVTIASKLTYFLKPAALCYPEACDRHDLVKHFAFYFAFECIGRVLQIFHGLANGGKYGKYEESLLLEAKELVDNLKGVRVDVDWLEERLSIQLETMAAKEEMTKYGALLKATQDKYNRLQDRYSEIESELSEKENYEMAAMCFERAGETETNLKKKEEKAECCALGEYERAGCVGSEEVLKELENEKQGESSDNVVVHGTDAVAHGTDAGGTDEPIEVQYDDVTHNVETLEPNSPMSSQEDELLKEKWNGVMIASKFAYYLKPAALRYPEVFTSLCDHHYLIKPALFQCIGRVLQIFHGLVRGIYEETLLSEAKELVDYLKCVSVDVDWLEEKLRIAEKTTMDKYEALQECYSKIEREVSTSIDYL